MVSYLNEHFFAVFNEGNVIFGLLQSLESDEPGSGALWDSWTCSNRIISVLRE